MFRKYVNLIIAIEHKVNSWFPEKPWSPGTWPLNHYNLSYAQWRFFWYKCIIFPVIAMFIFVPLAIVPVLLMLLPLSGNMKALGMIILGIVYFVILIRLIIKEWHNN